MSWYRRHFIPWAYEFGRKLKLVWHFQKPEIFVLCLYVVGYVVYSLWFDH